MRGRLIALLLALAPGIACSGTDSEALPADVADVTDIDQAEVVDTVAPAGGLAPLYEPGGDGWLAAPWPSDRFRGEDGALDLSTFPNPDDNLLVSSYLAYAAQVLRGWSTNGSVYFGLEGPIDPASLPGAEASMTDAAATVQLVDVSPSSPGWGQRVPLTFRSSAPGQSGWIDTHTLAVRPVSGFPLAANTTYCAFLTRGLLGADGKALAVASGFAAALDTEPSLAPLRTWLDESPLTAEDLVVATCFTTDDPVREMRRVAAFLDDQSAPVLQGLKPLGDEDGFRELEGHYIAPNFQFGEKPYDAGGDIRFDAAGEPVVQLMETVRFRLLYPKGGMPAAGWPVVLYSHGTGGSWKTCRSKVGSDLTGFGYAIVCIDQPLHGDRGIDGLDPTLHSFNFLNPPSGRTSFRQAAIDTLTQARMLVAGSFSLSAAETGAGQAFSVDADNLLFFGHSHGGLSGALALSLEPRLRGGVISGASGVLIETILRRKDPVDLEALVAGTLQLQEGELDALHPVMTLVQMVADATDPVNYARFWLHPEADGTPKELLVTSGTQDAASPLIGCEAMTAAGGLPIVAPPAHASQPHALRGIEAVPEPVTHNIDLGGGLKRTAAVRQFEGGTHGVAFGKAGKKRWRRFFKAALGGGAPTIGP